MKKLILSSLLLTAVTQLNAQLDSNSFSVMPMNPFGPAQFISTPINSSLQFTQDFTLECWVYVPTPAFPGTETHLIECYSSSNSGGYVLRLSQTNNVKGYAMGATQPSIIGNTSVPFNSWNHVATTYNSTTGELKVFLNGVQDGMSTPNSSIYNNATMLKIGARGDDSNINNSIIIDEVRIWNVTKTAAELSSAMNTCLAGDETGLVLYYDFEDETVSGTITDKSTNNNDGTYISNGETFGLGVFDCTAENLSLDATSTSGVSVFPNPTSDVINITTVEPTTITISTATGQIVCQLEIDASTSIDVSKFTAGAYFIQTSEGKTVRFMKK